MHGCVRDSRPRSGSGRQWTIAVSLVAVFLFAAAIPTAAHEAHGHPARIHEGTCDELGAVAFRLKGVGGSVDLGNAPVAMPAAVNPDLAYQVLISETTIDGELDDVLAADHAVMVYESDEAMDAIACGNVGGAMAGDMLITGLAEAGVPGHLGFAMFQPAGDRLTVSVIIGHALAPVSASGASADHDHHEEDGDAADDHEHDEEDADHSHDEKGAGDDAATPEA